MHGDIGVGGLGCVVPYPMYSHFTKTLQSTQGGFNLGGMNATGQVPDFPGNFLLIDRDTPKEAYRKQSWENPNEEMVLVFSDEFEQEGRTFYPGDDPFWEAVDLHYWGTENLEWYDPIQATTGNGSLLLTIEEALPINNHNMSYRSGMIQSWNKFCFIGGMVEASVRMPASPTEAGLWPAIWSMGNLGRAGYGGSLEGMWPYSYDSCDIGTVEYQSIPGTRSPPDAWINGDPKYDMQLSMLPGQKLSACTCEGESHPGPKRKNGRYVGRSAPEIDMFEAVVEDGVGMASFSAQFAPFNRAYILRNDTDSPNIIIHDTVGAHYNTYRGGGFQQTTSALARLNQDCYERSGTGCFATYAFEYKNGFDDGYITWVNDNKLSWTLRASALGPDPDTQIGQRIISQEPMYLIANLGLSETFGTLDLSKVPVPATMAVDWIRVYQPANAVNIGCDPVTAPTAKYIETYKRAYENFNLTKWVDHVKEAWPRNSIKDNC
ncbi:glycoside hydrolase family 16 protein [Panaeolus papilionaceus]|nr:glycoside hydrolase family 16 protein [Panaeolus papilionaceus]